MKSPLMLTGEAVSSGIGRGRALLCDCSKEAVAPRKRVAPEQVPKEIERFDAAVAAVEKNLQSLQRKIEGSIEKAEVEIFETQILLLRDVQLRDAVRKICEGERLNAEAAVSDTIEHLMGVFRNLADPFFQERAADLSDVGKRLLTRLAENSDPADPKAPEDCVIVTSNLLSSVVAGLDGSDVRGLIVEKGGPTAHATILAKALGIPMLVHVPNATKRIRSGDFVIVDALGGRVFINPPPEIGRQYDRVELDLASQRSALKNLIDLPSVTADGHAIKLGANVGQSADAVAAARVKADGCGLYRTEFVFSSQERFPSEDEQYRFYQTTAQPLGGGEMVIRLLDSGSDKPLAYFPLPRETNPALGIRGTRLLLEHPPLLHTQLRAILRLSASYPVAILLPMVSGLEEVRAVKGAVKAIKAQLSREGRAYASRTPLGIMIETPAAAVLAEKLADEVDFFNVGTNDLVQYLLAADRLSDRSDPACDPLHPAVIRTLAVLSATAKATNTPITLCGEIACDPSLTALLIGLGYRSFSVAPGQILEIRNALRHVRLPEAQRLATETLSLRTTREIRTFINESRSGSSSVSPLFISP